MLELAFETEEVRTLCERQAHAESRYGLLAARNLTHRVADLRAAGNVQDLIAGGLATVRTDSQQFAVPLGDGSRLVLSINHRRMPLLPDGDVDWAKVFRVKVLAIEVNDD